MSTSKMLQEIEQVLKKAPENRYSYYQLKHFVLGKEPTIQSQMWQCLKELQSRYDTIEALVFETENLKDDIELLQIEQEEMTQIVSKRHEVKIRKIKRQENHLIKQLNKLTSKIKFVKQEAQFFLDAFESLQKIESLKDYDDLEVQQDYWAAKISEEINLRILLNQSLSPDLVKMAIILHDGAEIKDHMFKMLTESKTRLTHKKELDGK